jgi:hypothetical protein
MTFYCRLRFCCGNVFTDRCLAMGIHVTICKINNILFEYVIWNIASVISIIWSLEIYYYLNSIVLNLVNFRFRLLGSMLLLVDNCRISSTWSSTCGCRLTWFIDWAFVEVWIDTDDNSCHRLTKSLLVLFAWFPLSRSLSPPSFNQHFALVVLFLSTVQLIGLALTQCHIGYVVCV